MFKVSTKKIIFRILSILFIFGGAARLFANRQVFRSFLIEELWSPHIYFVYIYRVLGAFVLFVGFTLFIISKDPSHYAKIIKTWSLGFLLIGMVMLFAGYFLRLSLIYYTPDFIFCFILATIFFVIAKR